MAEYWIVYEIDSGSELYRGSGDVGSSAFQSLPEGAAILLVPQSVVARPETNMSALRAAVAAQIDAKAEVVRLRFVTPGAGQAMTYQRKEAEARAYVADASTPTPFLSAEAPARGLTVLELAEEVVSQADAWVTVGAAIEAVRLGAKAAVARAANLREVVEAMSIDWSVFDAA